MLEIETLCKMRHIKWGGCCERRGIHGKCQIAKCKKMQNQRNFKSMLNITCKMPLLREKRRGRTKVDAYCRNVCLIDTDGTGQTRTHSGTQAIFTCWPLYSRCCFREILLHPLVHSQRVRIHFEQ